MSNTQFKTDKTRSEERPARRRYVLQLNCMLDGLVLLHELNFLDINLDLILKRRYNRGMKPKEKKDIFNFLEYNKNILQSYGVKKIGLFGSYVHNQQNKNSDIDILVEFHTDKKNYNNFINLVYYLEDNLNTKIDLLTIESLSPYIGQRILNEVEYVSIK